MIFFKHTELSETVIRFEAIENETVYGTCTLDLSGKNADLKEIDFPLDKPFFAEGLLKAAFNYAAGKNFYIGVCKCENINALLTRLGFIKCGDTYSLDIPSILMGSCCKK